MITNRLGLPEALVRYAEEQNKYQVKENQYSATALLKPIPALVLGRRHNDEIKQDVSDSLYALWGQGVHTILESVDMGPWVKKEMYLKVPFDGSTISGRIDLYDESTKQVIDWKTTGSFKIQKRDFEDFRKQLFIYAWLLVKSGYPVESVKAVMFIRDHSRTKAQFDPKYPDLPVEQVEWPFTKKDFEQTQAWISQRLKLIKEAESKSDAELGYCSKSDRWNSDEKWAVRKKTSQKALKLCSSEQEARDWIKDYLVKKPKVKEKDLLVEYRPGRDTRCEGYCSARPWCSLWKQSQP